jgi:hypothetical protein
VPVVRVPRVEDVGARFGNSVSLVCVENAVDVNTESTDGRSLTLAVGGVAVAELVVADLNAFNLRRARAATGAGEVEVRAVFRGSARWLATNLNAVQVRNPGARGSVTLRFGTGSADVLTRRFGDAVNLPRTAAIDTKRRVTNSRSATRRPPPLSTLRLLLRPTLTPSPA